MTRFVVQCAAVALAAMLVGSLMPMSAWLANVPVESPPEYDPASDGPDPGLGFLVFVVAILVCILIGVSIVIGIAVVAMAAVLIGLGVVSSSVLLGLIDRRPSTAFQAIFIQLGGLAGICCGVALLALAKWLFGMGLDWTWVVLTGGAAGLVAGVSVALLFNLAWTRILRWAIERFRAWKAGRRKEIPLDAPRT